MVLCCAARLKSAYDWTGRSGSQRRDNGGEGRWIWPWRARACFIGQMAVFVSFLVHL